MMLSYLSIVLIILCFSDYKIEGLQDDEEDPKQLIKRFHLECIEETRVDPERITAIKKQNWRIPEGQLLLVQDWSLCVMMKAGLMTKEGVYKIDVALSRVPPPNRRAVEEMIDGCLSKKAIPASEIAMKFIKCYQKLKGNYTVSALSMS